MYLPASFEETRLETLQALVRARPLATLITRDGGDGGAIVADHLPMQLLPASPCGVLRGHVARANPVWKTHREVDPALAIFQGPHAYISPSCYPTKAETGEVVPTWNYVVVHAHGTLRFVDDPGWLLAQVRSLTEEHEDGRALPWKVSDAPDAFVEKMLGGIVGFELTVTRLVGKWKISQNRRPEDQEGVVRGLGGSSDAEGQEIARMMAARLRPRESSS